MTSENVQAAQLIAEGPQDIWLTGDPQASFFRSMYRRHVSYGMSVEQFNLNGDTIRFDRRGDLLGACYLTASDPVTNVQLSTFPISSIARVDLFIGGQLVDSQDTTFSSQVWPVTEATTWSEQNVPSSFYPLHFFFCKDWSRAFPLVALEYHDLEIKIRDASSSYTFTLWAHMIHLSDPERAWYKRQPHRFLITQTQTARIDLQRDWGRFGGPIKYLAWPAKIVPPPGIVTGFTASNPTSTTVDLAWDPALYASSYSIVSLPATTTQTTSGTTLTFTGLDPDTEYTFYITASNTSGDGPSTTSNPITTLLPLPEAVTGFVVSNPTLSTVDLAWDPALNASSYSIVSLPATTTYTTSDTFFQFTGLDPDTEYTFYITPSNASGNGPSTTSNPISTLLPLPGFAPAMYYPTNETTTTIDLAWVEYTPEYATSFNVYAYSILDGLIGFVNVPISSFSYTYTGLQPDTEYYFSVAGVNATGVGESSSSITVYTLLPLPEAVTGFVVSNPTLTTVDLAWDPVLYASSYSIVSLPATTTYTTSDTFFTFPELTSNTEHTFIITPSNASGNGPSTTSNPISTLLPLPGSAPAMYEPTNVTATTMDLAWFEYTPEYATSFNVYAYSILDGLIGFVNVPISSFSYTYTGLTPDTEYYFSVAGVNATGVGEEGGGSISVYTLPLP